MNLKNIFKITPLKILLFVILYIALWLSHGWCSPYVWFGGAIMSNGEVGGGLETKCGFFSKWIWDNHTIYNIYTNINGWHILIITTFIILIGNFIIEIIKYKKQNKNIATKP